jgi:hypothetical protein
VIAQHPDKERIDVFRPRLDSTTFSFPNVKRTATASTRGLRELSSDILYPLNCTVPIYSRMVRKAFMSDGSKA